MRCLLRSFLPFVLALAGCGTGTGQPDVSFPAVFVSAATNEFVVDDVDVILDEARVAFGPAYFCASASGSATLCEAAVGEIRRVTAIDVLGEGETPLGTYAGFAGDVRSASYDYGIHWFLPEQEAQASPEAPGGHSARVRGVASRAGTSVRFEADIDVAPLFQGQRAVPTTKVEGTVTEATSRLEVRFDVASWLSAVDFGAALDAGADPFVLGPGARDHDAVVIRMVSTHPPSFDFVEGEAPAAP
ncbi:hypothetical protein [Polyangium jinanense]|uniref:Lipoprotein n=1 Tax=Polyangium jinanense TaxID=2829994 RepID=A0A9X3X1L3_9BACT|nr:hypothetical protein [Polyangium jinanense]MDC3956328.1 hypothetical protein [Polyangium jinanense]MDC3982464.1 hypothetical protein [Polyangium jinanense]